MMSLLQVSRATENMVYGVMANAPQDAADMTRPNTSHGNSSVIDPLGRVVDEVGTVARARAGRRFAACSKALMCDCSVCSTHFSNIAGQAGSFEERLVLAEVDLAAADGSTALRTIGGHGRYQQLYNLAPGNFHVDSFIVDDANMNLQHSFSSLRSVDDRCVQERASTQSTRRG